MKITFDATDAVVVGTDLSGRAEKAVAWAADRAQLIGTRLVVVIVLPEVPIPPRSRMFDAMTTGDWPAHLRNVATTRLAEIKTELERSHPGLVVETVLTEGVASYVLAQASKVARIVVVGARGAGAPATVRALGGTADAVVAHAHGPVAVITEGGESTPQGPVYVGVDDSPQSKEALEIAVREAVLCKVPLVAVHAWDPMPALMGPMGMVEVIDTRPQREALHEMVEEFLEPYRAQHPELDARAEVEQGRPASVLVKASKEASCVTVGARGLGGFTGLLLGSTSKEVLREAECPVVVLRAARKK